MPLLHELQCHLVGDHCTKRVSAEIEWSGGLMSQHRGNVTRGHLTDGVGEWGFGGPAKTEKGTIRSHMHGETVQGAARRRRFRGHRRMADDDQVAEVPRPDPSRPGSGSSPESICASPAMVRPPASTSTVRVRPNRASMVANRLTSARESPPRSKKSDRTPIGDTCNTSSQISAISRSSLVSGGWLAGV